MIPRLGRSPGEGNGNPSQYSCLENPMDRGAWQATVHGVARAGHDLATKPAPHSSRGQNSKMSCCSVTQSCPTLCDPMDYSTPGFPVLHYLPEFVPTLVHQVSDAISPSVAPFSSCPQSLLASEFFPMSWLFALSGQNIRASASASVLPMNIQG